MEISYTSFNITFVTFYTTVEPPAIHLSSYFANGMYTVYCSEDSNTESRVFLLIPGKYRHQGSFTISQKYKYIMKMCLL